MMLTDHKIKYSSFRFQIIICNMKRVVAEMKLPEQKELPIYIDYSELDDPEIDISDRISDGFGKNGLGAVIITNVPKTMELRKKLLKLAHDLAHLPEESLEKLKHPEILGTVGWSVGINNNKDLQKASFYANPQTDDPIRDMDGKFAEILYPKNHWPEELPELEKAFKEFGLHMIDVALLLANHLDSYIKSKCQNYEDGKFKRIIKESQTCKGRLLHYYPGTTETEKLDNWCHYHYDMGTLTGLCKAIYIDKDGNETTVDDKETGLYIKKSSGVVVKIEIPEDGLMFQLGRAGGYHSGGHLVPALHGVRRGKDCGKNGISRNTFIVMMSPNGTESMADPDGNITKYSKKFFSDFVSEIVYEDVIV